MRQRRVALWAGIIVGAVLLLCVGGAVAYVNFWHKTPAAGQTGDTKLMTLAEVEDQTRIQTPKGAKLVFGEMYVLDDWNVAAEIRFDKAAMRDFLTNSGLPTPIADRRPVPLAGPVAPAGAPAPPDPSSTVPAPPVIPSASATATPGPRPSAPGPLMRDASDWHPERAATVAGIDSDVHESVIRWVMFDLDDPQQVTVYLYAGPAVPHSNGSMGASAPAGRSAAPTARKS